MFITTVLVLAFAGSARAQDTLISATLNPNTPATGTKLHVAVGGAAPELAGALPETLSLDLQRGFLLDVATIPTRCDASHVPKGDCPAASRIGSGAALVHASGLVNADVPVDDRRLPRRPGAGRRSRERRAAAGRRRAVQGIRARLITLPSGPFGYELRAAGFAGAVPTIPGATLALKNLTLDIGKRRNILTTVTKRVKTARNGKRVTVTKKVTRKVRHDLIKTPKTSSGDLRPQRPAFSASSAFSPRPATIMTTTQIVATAGSSTTHVKRSPMLSVQPCERASIACDCMCPGEYPPRPRTGPAVATLATLV